MQSESQIKIESRPYFIHPTQQHSRSAPQLLFTAHTYESHMFK